MQSYSTDKVFYNNYKPHGHVQITITSKNLVEYIATGPFNKEFMKSLALVESQALNGQNIDLNCWYGIVFFQGSCATTKDFMDDFHSYLSDAIKNNEKPTATAYVIPEKVEGRIIMNQLFREAFQVAGIQFQVFNNESEARSWIKKCRAKE